MVPSNRGFRHAQPTSPTALPRPDTEPRAVLSLTGAGVWVPVRGERVELLRDVDWTVLEGERWALLGRNGAGKTTLLTLAGALRHPSYGTVEVLGNQLGRVDIRELHALVGSVSSVQRVPGELSVTEYVLTGATGTVQRLPGKLTRDDRGRAAELIEMLGLPGIADRPMAVCSQGERGRAKIARALLPQPRLLLLDEPTAALDLPSREELLDAIATLAAEVPALALVVVSHHLEELPVCVGHAMLLSAGAKVAMGPVEHVLTGANLTHAYGLPLRVGREHGRWSAHLDRRLVREGRGGG